MAELLKLSGLRRMNHITQEEMATLISVTTRTYIKKEKGENEFKANEMFIISKKLNRSVEEIFLPENFMPHEMKRCTHA